jgi:hypothetical protein
MAEAVWRAYFVDLAEVVAKAEECGRVLGVSVSQEKAIALALALPETIQDHLAGTRRLLAAVAKLAAVMVPLPAKSYCAGSTATCLGKGAPLQMIKCPDCPQHCARPAATLCHACAQSVKVSCPDCCIYGKRVCMFCGFISAEHFKLQEEKAHCARMCGRRGYICLCCQTVQGPVCLQCC